MSAQTGSVDPRPARGLSARTRQRLVRGALVVAVCVGVTAVALGAGYRSSEAVLGDDSAYVQRGHTVAHVNATSGRSDAQAAKEMATGSEHLEVVQVSPGVVYVVNNDTGQVYRLPTDTLSPQPVTGASAAKGKSAPRVVTGHQQTYLVDGGHGTVTYLPGAGTEGQRRVPVPHPVGQVVVDSHGTAWGLAAATGELYRIVRGVVAQRIAVGGRGAASLTLADDRPVVYRPAAGTIAEYTTAGVYRHLEIPPEPLAVLAAPGADSNVAVIVEPRTAQVVAVDFAADSADMVALPGRAGGRFGPPVVLNGRAYVPDYRAHQVVVVDLHPLRVTGYTPVPGASDQFDVFVRDGRVWANDGYAKDMVTFDRDGHHSTLDKGTGESASPSPRSATARPPERADPPPPDTRATPGPSTHSDATPPPGRTPHASATPTGPAPPTAKRIRMPAVVGQDKGAACQRVRAAGFTQDCALVAKPDQGGATGEVLSTNPAAGTRVGADTKVTLFYRGPFEVPDLAGMTADNACAALVAVRLTCQRQVTGLADAAAGVNVVAGQQPAAHARVATGTGVSIQYPTRIRVPNVVPAPQLDQATACQRITDAGLACAPQSRGACQPAGAVVDQSPPADSAADPGASVAVGACLPNTTVPDLTNLDPSAACAALQQAQLACAPNAGEASRTPNQVHSQNPAPGAVVAATTQVSYVYAGDAPVGLTRWKMRDADVPHHAEFLAATGGPAAPSGWAPQSSPGDVYAPGAGQIANVVPIYAFVCTTGCAEAGSYYYSQRNTDAGAGWQLQGEVFRGFSVQAAGTVPLQEMFVRWSYKNSAGTTVSVLDWVLAVQGSAEYQYFRDQVGGGHFEREYTLCYIWPPA